jgi:hypothetical protein
MQRVTANAPLPLALPLQVRECFGADADLYAILGVDKGASKDAIKRAYYKKALQWVRTMCMLAECLGLRRSSACAAFPGPVWRLASRQRRTHSHATRTPNTCTHTRNTNAAAPRQVRRRRRGHKAISGPEPRAQVSRRAFLGEIVLPCDAQCCAHSDVPAGPRGSHPRLGTLHRVPCRCAACVPCRSILSDPKKRTEYDRTGDLESAADGGDSESFDVWYEYWRGMFPPVTTEVR